MSNITLVPEPNSKKKRVGIGFFTGRALFPTLLKFYTRNWKYGPFADKDKYSLNLFIAYDSSYNGIKPEVFQNLDQEILDMADSTCFIDDAMIQHEINDLDLHNISAAEETQQVLGMGYAKRRNAITYFAVKHHMDYLLFIDDDEYPLAVYEHKNYIFWQRQDILETHLNYLDQADITHGHHCGYISPIPVFNVDNSRIKNVMSKFLQAVSNDIVSVEAVADRQKRGGVDYASLETVTGNPYPVEEENGLKFISGSNLGLNLRTFYKNKPLPPFYNPEGARGEDTFLSACLSAYKVLKVPCYTFHDGFLKYNKILQGILPNRLQAVKPNNSKIIKRFYKACLGWVRYKPLLLYITDQENFEMNVEKVRRNLNYSVPVISKALHYKFYPLIDEFNKYVSLVAVHYYQFKNCQNIWNKICQYAASIIIPASKQVIDSDSCTLNTYQCQNVIY